MATIFPTSIPSKRLAASITGASMAFQLNNILSWDGVTNLAASDFGTLAYGAFRNDTNTAIEFFAFDPSTIASGSITILFRGLKFTGDYTTEVSANKLTWVKNQTIVELGADVPQLMKHFVADIGDQSIDGIKTFTSSPIVPVPTTSTQAASKGYVDGVAIAGAPNASSTVKGISKLTLDPVSPTAPIAVGDNDTRVPTQSENDALVGTSGTPSTSNKYVTNDDTATSGVSKVLRLTSTGAYPALNGADITNIQLSESFPRGETVNGATTPVPVVLIDDTFQEEFGGAVTIAMGKVTTGNKAALGFKLQGAITLTTLKLYLKKTGAPTDNIVFTIQTDTAGAPSGTPVTNGTANSIAGSGLTTSFVLTTVTFGSTVTLAANTQYWLVGARSSTTSNSDYYNLDGITNAFAYASFTGSTFDASSWSVSADIPYVQFIAATGNSTSVWRCDTDHANFHMRYGVGLVTTNGAISVSAKVVFRGPVTGFTGLTPMSLYYASDTIGTLSLTPGTTEVIIGQSISTTEIFVGMGSDTQQYIGTTTLVAGANTLPWSFKRARFAFIVALVVTGTATSRVAVPLYKKGASNYTAGDVQTVPNSAASITLTWTSDTVITLALADNSTSFSTINIYFYK